MSRVRVSGASVAIRPRHSRPWSSVIRTFCPFLTRRPISSASACDDAGWAGVPVPCSGGCDAPALIDAEDRAATNLGIPDEQTQAPLGPGWACSFVVQVCQARLQHIRAQRSRAQHADQMPKHAIGGPHGLLCQLRALRIICAAFRTRFPPVVSRYFRRAGPVPSSSASHDSTYPFCSIRCSVT
jgi:hypothetical protein